MAETRRETRLEFGPYSLDTAQLLLFRGGEVVPLTPKLLQLLAVLVEERGRTLSREELNARVWPDVVTSPGNLHQCVSKLRKTLGAAPGGGAYIETEAGQGYRWNAEVRSAGAPAAGRPAHTPLPTDRRRTALRAAG